MNVVVVVVVGGGGGGLHHRGAVQTLSINNHCNRLT